MSVYIKGMEMPKEGFVEVLIRDDGTVQQTGQSYRLGGTDYYTPYVGEMPQIYSAVSVPEHGDLIDRNVLYAKATEWEQQAMHLANTSPDARTFDKWSNILTERSAFKFDIADVPTIIPASKEDRE